MELCPETRAEVDSLSQILDGLLTEPELPGHNPFLDPHKSCRDCGDMSRVLVEQLQLKCLKSAVKNTDASLTIHLAAIDAWQQVSCDDKVHLGQEHFERLLTCAVESLQDQTYANELMFLRVCVSHNKTRCLSCSEYRTIRIKRPILIQQRILRRHVQKS